MYGPCPDRYPAIMSESIARMSSKCSIDQVAWKELETKPKMKSKGDKRNGAMSRQQAFGGLVKSRYK